MVSKERVLEEADHPVPFLIAVTLFVVGFSAFLLWGMKNLKLTGAVRVIQQD
jgi:hypothetical protein